MSDIKFSCPVCAQHISCTAEWAGMQIKCPACEKEIVIPELRARPVAPAPVPAAPGPLKVSIIAQAAPKVSHAAPPPPPPPPRGPAPVYSPPTYAAAESGSSSGKGVRIAMWAAVIVIVPLVLYMAFTWASSAQKKLNVAREREAEEADGGQLGHIAELNSVLDATDPNKHAPVGSLDDDVPVKFVEEKVNPPVWTLNLAAAKVPSGKANGTISGSPFVVDRAYLQKTPTGYALTVRQGMGFQAEREVLISLPLKATENLDGRSWQLSPNSTNGLRLITRWLAAGRQQTKVYTNGYALVLEFGRSTMDGVQARMFVALPDDEKTVVGGSFEASYLLAGGTAPRPMRRERDYEGEF